MTFGQVFTGLILIVVGFFYTRYSAKIAEIVGDLGFGSKIFGAGGEYTMHQVIGVIFIIIGILWTTGGFQYLLTASVGKLFGGMAAEAPAAAGLLIFFN